MTKKGLEVRSDHGRRYMVRSGLGPSIWVSQVDHGSMQRVMNVIKSNHGNELIRLHGNQLDETVRVNHHTQCEMIDSTRSHTNWAYGIFV